MLDKEYSWKCFPEGLYDVPVHARLEDLKIPPPGITVPPWGCWCCWSCCGCFAHSNSMHPGAARDRKGRCRKLRGGILLSVVTPLAGPFLIGRRRLSDQALCGQLLPFVSVFVDLGERADEPGPFIGLGDADLLSHVVDEHLTV